MYAYVAYNRITDIWEIMSLAFSSDILIRPHFTQEGKDRFDGPYLVKLKSFEYKQTDDIFNYNALVYDLPKPLTLEQRIAENRKILASMI